MTDLIIPDLSEFQQVVDFGALCAQHPAVIIRALYGTGHVDNYWSRNIGGARANAKWVGIYQYLVKSQSAHDQAARFVQVMDAVGGMRPNEIAVIDIEEGDPGAAFAAGDQWVNEVHSLLAGVEWEYSYSAFLRHNVQWLAAYQGNEPAAPHKLWQFTDRQPFPGVSSPCDASVFHGSINDLLALTGSTVPQSPEDDMSAADIAQINAKLDALATQVAAVKAAELASDIQAIAQAELGRFLEESALNFFWGQILKGEKDIYGVKDEIAASPEAVAHQKALAAPKAP